MKKIYLVIAFFAFLAANSIAQTADTTKTTDPIVHPKPGSSAPIHDLAQAAANPIANMVTVPFQFNFNFGVGEYDRTQTVLNLQPVLPFHLSGTTWSVINRVIIPIIQQPENAETGSAYGLGNTTVTSFFVPPSKKGLFTWGIGPALSIPTSTSAQFGGDAFGIGPTIVMLWMPGHWVAGFTGAQTWSYKTDDLSSFFGQYFVTWNIKKGWFLNMAPTITANFNAAEGEQWTVPVGGGFGKIVHFNAFPVKFFINYYNYVVKPTGGPDSNITFMAILLFPKKPKE